MSQEIRLVDIARRIAGSFNLPLTSRHKDAIQLLTMTCVICKVPDSAIELKTGLPRETVQELQFLLEAVLAAVQDEMGSPTHHPVMDGGQS